MSTQETAKNALKQKANQQPSKQPKTIRDYVKRMANGIASALPSAITPERFTRIVLTALTTNKKLNECTPESFCGAMMQAAQLGLEPNTPTGEAYLIPYGKQCQFQIGYRGLLKLVRRSGEVKSIRVETVYENEDFDFELGLNPTLHHKALLKDRGEPIAFYAIYTTKDGEVNFKVMGIEEIRNHMKQYSKNYNSPSSPWKTNFEAMAKKTVLIQLLKYAPMSTEVVKGIANDGTTKNINPEQFENEHVEVLDLPDETEYEIVPETGEIVMQGVTDVQSE